MWHEPCAKLPIDAGVLLLDDIYRAPRLPIFPILSYFLKISYIFPIFVQFSYFFLFFWYFQYNLCIMCNIFLLLYCCLDKSVLTTLENTRTLFKLRTLWKITCAIINSHVVGVSDASKRSIHVYATDIGQLTYICVACYVKQALYSYARMLINIPISIAYDMWHSYLRNSLLDINVQYSGSNDAHLWGVSDK